MEVSVELTQRVIESAVLTIEYVSEYKVAQGHIVGEDDVRFDYKSDHFHAIKELYHSLEECILDVQIYNIERFVDENGNVVSENKKYKPKESYAAKLLFEDLFYNVHTNYLSSMYHRVHNKYMAYLQKAELASLSCEEKSAYAALPDWERYSYAKVYFYYETLYSILKGVPSLDADAMGKLYICDCYTYFYSFTARINREELEEFCKQSSEVDMERLNLPQYGYYVSDLCPEIVCRYIVPAFYFNLGLGGEKLVAELCNEKKIKRLDIFNLSNYFIGPH